MHARSLAVVAFILMLAACATRPVERAAPYPTGPAPVIAPMPTAVHALGRVVRIDAIAGDRRTDGSGAVVGGVLGGVLGNQVGRGDGKTAATVAGVVAGAAIGNAAQKDANAAPSFDIRVQMEDGRRLIVNQRELGGITVGSTVDIYDNRAHLLR